MAHNLGSLSAATITDDLVTQLVSSQMPDLSDHEIGRHYRAGDHVAVRIGDHYGVILPLTADFSTYIGRCADVIAGHLERWTFTVSAPIRTGVPADGFPYYWALIPWFERPIARFAPLAAPAAAPLGRALREVHSRAPANAPVNPRTSVSMDELSKEFDQLVSTSAQSTSRKGRRPKFEVLEALWANAVSTDVDRAPTWTHGDLTPLAVLSDQGGLGGLVLWHYFGAGDPWMDLGQACLLVPTDARPDLLDAYSTVTPPMFDVVQGFELLFALRYIVAGEPFDADLAWRRLAELDLLDTPAVQ